MNNLLLLMLAFSISLSTFADSRLTRFDDPIPVAPYVLDARSVIVAGMKKHGWTIHAENNQYIDALLEKSENKVILRIGFDNQQISFTRISDVSTRCGKHNFKRLSSCPVDDDDMNRWRNNLRKAILKQIEMMARYDALKHYMESTGKALPRSTVNTPEADGAELEADSES